MFFIQNNVPVRFSFKPITNTAKGQNGNKSILFQPPNKSCGCIGFHGLSSTRVNKNETIRKASIKLTVNNNIPKNIKNT